MTDIKERINTLCKKIAAYSNGENTNIQSILIRDIPFLVSLIEYQDKKIQKVIAACGHPDAAEACRIILEICRE